MSPLPGPSWEGLAWSALPVSAVALILVGRRLGQARPLAIALARLVVQLWLLGLVLGWVFAHQGPWLVLAIALAMLTASAHTVGERQRAGGWALRAEAFASLALGVVITMAVSVRLGLRLAPWYEARTVVPLLGMVLGNSVSGVSLAAERLESELRADRDLVERRLALGATSRQAALPALRAAVRAALTPTINNMMIAGIVSIPGMTTGQLLAGADLGSAVRYQVLVYLAITGTVGLSTLALLGLRLRRYFTPAHQLRPEALDG
jgi:putative ABC transport system permease protein